MMESMPPHDSGAGPVAGMLAEARELPPWLVPAHVRSHAARRGAIDAALLVQDYAEAVLVPVTDEGLGEPATGAEAIEGTLAGRAFTLQQPVETVVDGSLRLFLPLIDGGERVGVLVLTLPALDDDRQRAAWVEFAAVVTALMVSKGRATDVYFRARRRRDMSLAAEMQWHLLPPLSVVEPRLAVAGVVEPAYDVGGDAFDYAFNQENAHLAVFDAMGHGLEAAVMAAVTVSAYRHSRRGGAAIEDMYTLVDTAFGTQFGGDRFVTGQLANLHLPTGELAFVNAGHPPPLHLRDNRVIGPITGPVNLPIGLGGPPPEVVTVALQPGDRVLFYTDGVVEARRDGTTYGDRRLAVDIEHVLGDDLPLPEIVRRLNGRLTHWRGGVPEDDATLVIAEWRGRDLTLP